MKSAIRSVPAYIVLLCLSAGFVLPFIWMVSSSLKDTNQIFQFPPNIVPRPVVWRNYSDAVQFIPFLRYLCNTLIICVCCIIGNVLSASLVAFSLATLHWRGRDVCFKILVASMLLPPQVTMIPVFVIFRTLGMIDTYGPLILPSFLGSPFFIFLLRQFFMGVPRDLPEAARIDGCSEWGIYWRIIAPLSFPALAAVVLFSFIWTWTDFLTPLIYLQDQTKFTLSLGLQQFQESHSAEWGMLMAASTLITIPMILLFVAAQKTFVQGIVTTGLKG
ncbi:MAG: carbohydrate ABC transporter permease [bacterium]|nr:carbohydrate ABC transporter permease [Candidatus Sumerlaeota bacterium]